MSAFYLSRAQTTFRHGQPDQALSDVRTALALVPDCPEANYLLACLLLEYSRHEEALPTLRACVQSWPEDAATWYAIGVCCDYLDQLPEAIDAYRMTLHLAPHWVIALKHMGRCAWRQGDERLAFSALRRYCEDSPDDTEAHDLMGYLAYGQGRLRESFSHYVAATRLAPTNTKLDRNARLLYKKSATS